MGLSLFSFLKRLSVALAVDGKSLVAWLTLQIPGLVQYPGLVEALQSFAGTPTVASFIAVAWQILFAGAAGHRLVKILSKVLVTAPVVE